jgi:hypothetical protein
MQIIKFSDFMDGSYKTNELSVKETDFFETFQLLVGLAVFGLGLAFAPQITSAIMAIFEPAFQPYSLGGGIL